MKPVLKRVLVRWWSSSVGYHGYIEMDNTEVHTQGELIHVLEDFIHGEVMKTQYGVSFTTKDGVEYYMSDMDRKINGG